MFERALIHDPYCLGAAAPRVRMRTEDDRVPRLDGHDAFKEHGGSRICNWSEREDDPDRVGDLKQITLWDVANDADRALILYVVVDKFRRHHVLEELVFHHAQPGFLNREARKILGLLQTGQHHSLDDSIYILLGVLSEDRRCGPGLADESLQMLNSFSTQSFRCQRYLHSLRYCFERRHDCPLNNRRRSLTQQAAAIVFSDRGR